MTVSEVTVNSVAKLFFFSVTVLRLIRLLMTVRNLELARLTTTFLCLCLMTFSESVTEPHLMYLISDRLLSVCFGPNRAN